jgi:sugar (pentulose or hexulose) kinase
MEGILLELLDIFKIQEEIFSSIGIKIREIKISGGIINSKFWMKLFADILQHDLVLTNARELGTLGSAILAASAVNCYDNIEDSISGMITNKGLIKHDKGKKKYYEKKLRVFRGLYQILEEEGFELLESQY